MPPIPDSVSEDLLAEAERRAKSLRASGQLPSGIDERLADNYARSFRRDTERAPLDSRAAIESLRQDSPFRLPPMPGQSAQPDPTTAQRVIRRVKRSLHNRPRSRVKALRFQVAGVLEAMAAENNRLRELADNAVATADMLAERVTDLERRLASKQEASLTTQHPDDPQP